VLVARTTDPSWASVMYPAAALVVEVGGQLSHAAVVARELGIPCVMGVPDATRSLRDGDRIRVDGSAGTVEVLERSASGTSISTEASPGLFERRQPVGQLIVEVVGQRRAGERVEVRLPARRPDDEPRRHR